MSEARLFDLTPLYAEAETDRFGVTWRSATADDVNDLLRREHYLGPLDRRRLVLGGFLDGDAVAAQVWAWPTSRHLPSDGTWLELVRWCLTPAAGENAGSRMHRFSRRYILRVLPKVTTLVSYSDPSQGHTGALYKSCNWTWAPTWHRLFPPPSGNGDWGTGSQHVKDRWVFVLRADPRRDEVLRVKDGRAEGLADGAVTGTRALAASPGGSTRTKGDQRVQNHPTHDPDSEVGSLETDQ